MKIRNLKKKKPTRRVVTTRGTSPFVRQQSADGRYVEIIVTTATGKITYRVPKEPLEIKAETLIQDAPEALTG